MISVWNLTRTKYGRQKNRSKVQNNDFDWNEEEVTNPQNILHNYNKSYT
jgi:hypothetical protein